MEDEKKSPEVSSAPSAALPDVSFGTTEDTPQYISLGKKILYKLWDADQHLKSPQVRLPLYDHDFVVLLTLCHRNARWSES